MKTTSKNSYRERWCDLSIKTKMTLISACLSFLIGWGITIFGFVVEPTGEVHNSVLWILGQALTYAGAAFGVTIYFKSEALEMKRSIAEELNRLNNKNREDEEK